MKIGAVFLLETVSLGITNKTIHSCHSESKININVTYENEQAVKAFIWLKKKLIIKVNISEWHAFYQRVYIELFILSTST